jgi:hypothetical protein
MGYELVERFQVVPRRDLTKLYRECCSSQEARDYMATKIEEWEEKCWAANQAPGGAVSPPKPEFVLLHVFRGELV